MNEIDRTQLKKRVVALAIASCMSLAPWAVQAAGLGKLTVFSNLGQPLRAEVEISAERDELPGMTARLAPADIFKQAGVDLAPALNDLRFSIEKRPNGKSVIKLSSSRPVNDPFLDFLVELNWPTGRMVREYTFLLDPPEYASGRGARSVADARVVDTVRDTTMAPSPVSRAPAEPRPVAPKVATTAKKAEAEGATHQVARGETLRKIAAQYQPTGASLEQMLVALFRNNREAFIADDINRLKAGAILNIPDAGVAQAVSERDARNVYVATGDFAAYRDRLAAAAAKAPPKTEVASAQSSAGRITPKVEEQMPAVDPSKDQVKVTRPDAAGKTGAQAEEDRVAREKALQEATERLVTLEKNVRELQELLALKNQRLAELEQSPAAKDKPASEAGAATPAGAPVTPAAPAAPPAAKPAPAKPVASPPPAPIEEPSLVDSLLADPLPLAGGAGVLALLAGLFLYRRQRAGKAAPDAQATLGVRGASGFGATGGQSIDTGNTPPQTGDFSQAGPGTIDTDEVDPVAEADVYMAYGRDAQAEEILLEALQKDPQRLAIHVKLLEIYANRHSLKQFETLAAELYAQTAGVGAEWEKVAALGVRLDPENPLYARGGAAVEPVPAAKHFDADATVVVSPQQLVAAGVATAGIAAAAELASAEGDLADLQFDSPAVEEAVPEKSDVDVTVADEVSLAPEVLAPATADDAMSLDFDLGDALPATTETPVPAAADAEAFEQVAAQAPSASFAEPAVDDAGALDFDLSALVGADEGPAENESALDQVESPQSAAEVQAEEIVGFDFDLSIPDSAAEEPVASEQGAAVQEELTAADTRLGDFELPEVAFDMADAPAAAPAAEERTSLEKPALAPVAEAVAANELDLSDLAFEIPDEPGAAAPASEAHPAATAADDWLSEAVESVADEPPAELPEFDMSSINLDLAVEPAANSELDALTASLAEGAALDETPVAPLSADSPLAEVSFDEPDAVPPEAAAPVHDARWEEVNTKLDLAKAYEEMGDLEGARELLQEVVAEGPADLVEQAEALFARIGR